MGENHAIHAFQSITKDLAEFTTKTLWCAVKSWGDTVSTIQLLLGIGAVFIAGSAYELTDVAKELLQAGNGYLFPMRLASVYVIIRLMCAPFVVWRAERLKCNRLNRALEPQRILDGIAPLLRRGRDLKEAMMKGFPKLAFDVDTIMSDSQEWAKAVKHYLGEEMGEDAITEFETHFYTVSGLSEEVAAVHMFLGRRVNALNKIVEDLRSKTHAIRPETHI